MPGCEVIIFGDEHGSAEMAREIEARHVPGVALSAAGTPIVSDMFSQASVIARRPILCFANADVIFTSTLLDAVRRVARRRFLLIGQRWDLDVNDDLDFGGDWEADLLKRVRANGVLHPRAGSDYFAYPRDVDWQMPPFAIGRVGWDNWTLRRARDLSLDVIDATRVVAAIHQNHEYTPAQRPPGGVVDAPEAAENLRLLDGRLATLYHANRVLTRRFILPAIEPGRLAGRLASSHFVGLVRFGYRRLRRG